MAAASPAPAETPIMDSSNDENFKTNIDRSHTDDTTATDEKHNCNDTQMSDQTMYRNSLLAMVGWLDFTNSLDFPANIFNDTPIPVHALVLMALGGSVAIIATAWGMWDMRRCWKNIKFLRAERRAIQQEQKKWPNGSNAQLRRAWLGVNFRELGWELADRFLLDLIMTISGFFVGAGTLMAMRGEDPRIFMASNLLSGYVGNSWLPLYAAISSIWSVYMYIRASRSGECIQQSDIPLDEQTSEALRTNHARHKIFSSCTATTICISSVGAMMSATMWHGYVVLAPCCIASVILNWYWRKRLGYNRPSYSDWVGWSQDGFDISDRIKANMAAKAYITHDIDLAGDLTTVQQGTAKDTLAESPIETLMANVDLRESFHRRLLPRDSFDSVGVIASIEVELQRCIAGSIIRKVGIDHFQSRERFLLELYGYSLYYADPHDAQNLAERV